MHRKENVSASDLSETKDAALAKVSNPEELANLVDHHNNVVLPQRYKCSAGDLIGMVPAYESFPDYARNKALMPSALRSAASILRWAVFQDACRKPVKKRCIFLAACPGSGKTTVSKNLHGSDAIVVDGTMGEDFDEVLQNIQQAKLHIEKFQIVYVDRGIKQAAKAVVDRAVKETTPIDGVGRAMSEDIIADRAFHAMGNYLQLHENFKNDRHFEFGVVINIARPEDMYYISGMDAIAHVQSLSNRYSSKEGVLKDVHDSIMEKYADCEENGHPISLKIIEGVSGKAVMEEIQTQRRGKKAVLAHG